jgi:hypothetical protein
MVNSIGPSVYFIYSLVLLVICVSGVPRNFMWAGKYSIIPWILVAGESAIIPLAFKDDLQPELWVLLAVVCGVVLLGMGVASFACPVDFNARKMIRAYFAGESFADAQRRDPFLDGEIMEQTGTDYDSKT